MIEKAYHHGALREAMMEVGLEMLAERSVEDLSMREIARRVGVSATAVYRHFSDKASLLAAIARQGLDRLSAVQHHAMEMAGGGEAGFYATGRAYVEFAVAHPALFRLILAHPSSHPPLDRPVARMPDAMAFLVSNAAEFAPPGIDPRLYALHSWSVAHGLAMLLLDGQVRADGATIQAIVEMRPIANQPDHAATGSATASQGLSQV